MVSAGGGGGSADSPDPAALGSGPGVRVSATIVTSPPSPQAATKSIAILAMGALKRRRAHLWIIKLNTCIDLLAEPCLNASQPEGVRWGESSWASPIHYRRDASSPPRRLGAFALIFIGAGAIIVTGGANLVAIAIAHGLAIALMISAVGHISGGLYNPALTIGLWATRRISTVSGILYIIAQLVGAVVAALALTLLFPDVMREATKLGTPGVSPGIDFVQAVGIEAIATFFLMTAVFGTALDPRGPALGGFGIGLVLTMDILAVGALTGAAMNPARAFGPALLSGTWDDHLVWWIGPIIGAVLAAVVYHYVFADEQEAPVGVP